MGDRSKCQKKPPPAHVWMQGRWLWWESGRKNEKDHLQLAFGREGGGGGGSHIEMMTVTTSSSHFDAREVVVVAAWVQWALVAGEGRRNGRKWAMSFVVACFRDALLGPPTSWVPPHISPPPTPLLLD